MSCGVSEAFQQVPAGSRWPKGAFRDLREYQAFPEDFRGILASFQNTQGPEVLRGVPRRSQGISRGYQEMSGAARASFREVPGILRSASRGL